jgi:hypothetical protein
VAEASLIPAPAESQAFQMSASSRHEDAHVSTSFWSIRLLIQEAGENMKVRSLVTLSTLTLASALLAACGGGSRWGLYFSGGNCLDGDSDAFHYIGYAESNDLKTWTVYNDINSPIASINAITTTNQGGSKATVTVPANAPIIPTQTWFAQRLYAPTATHIDAQRT